MYLNRRVDVRTCCLIHHWSHIRALDSPLMQTLHTWRKLRMAPLILSESAAMPAIPPPPVSPWSLSCLNEVEGTAPCACAQLAPQHGAEASGCELCLIILEPGNVVTTDGAATGHELHTCKVHQPCAISRYLGFVPYLTPISLCGIGTITFTSSYLQIGYVTHSDQQEK